MSRKHFEVVRHFTRSTPSGTTSSSSRSASTASTTGSGSIHDPEHVLHEPGNPFQDVIRDYYRYLDDEIGRLLELLTDDTIVLVVSDHGAQRLDGGFCVNEWLVREGLLVAARVSRQRSRRSASST